ncbi:hypothetical protein D3C78_1341720 [compost metagenome]
MLQALPLCLCIKLTGHRNDKLIAIMRAGCGRQCQFTRQASNYRRINDTVFTRVILGHSPRRSGTGNAFLDDLVELFKQTTASKTIDKVRLQPPAERIPDLSEKWHIKGFGQLTSQTHHGLALQYDPYRINFL